MGDRGDLSRRLDRLHDADPPALGDGRSGRPGPGQRLQVGTVRPDEGLDAERRSAPPVPGEAQGNAGLVLEEAAQVRGAAAGHLGGDALGGATAQHHGGPHRVHLYPAGDRHSAGRLAAAAEHVLHHHGRGGDPGGRRRGHAADLRRPVRRLRFLPAQGQAGVPLEPGGFEAGPLGRARSASRPASTRWSSTSSTTVSAPKRWPSTT